MKKFKITNHINLVSPILGSKIYEFSDQFFGKASRLIKDENPIFKDGVYDSHGKWMDGWETRRKRDKGNDYVIIKLGIPGKIFNLTKFTILLFLTLNLWKKLGLSFFLFKRFCHLNSEFVEKQTSIEANSG